MRLAVDAYGAVAAGAELEHEPVSPPRCANVREIDAGVCRFAHRGWLADVAAHEHPRVADGGRHAQ